MKIKTDEDVAWLRRHYWEEIANCRKRIASIESKLGILDEIEEDEKKRRRAQKRENNKHKTR